MWIKIGTTQCRQYDFLGWSDVIGRSFFYLREIGWGGAYDIGLTLKVEKMSQWKRKNNYLVRLLETILQP